MKDGAPVFVKIDDYKDVLDIMSLLKEKINEANSILDKISEVKSKEDAEIENWRSNIEDLQLKISTMDKTILDVNVDE
ncbi:MAG: hypothetical protein ACMXX8_02005 [Candidatus Woesearchaeota archaeon]